MHVRHGSSDVHAQDGFKPSKTVVTTKPSFVTEKIRVTQQTPWPGDNRENTSFDF